jgi:hypothetical protein
VRTAAPVLVRRVVCVDPDLAALAAQLGHDVVVGDPAGLDFDPAPAAGATLHD